MGVKRGLKRHGLSVSQLLEDDAEEEYEEEDEEASYGDMILKSGQQGKSTFRKLFESIYEPYNFTGKVFVELRSGDEEVATELVRFFFA